MSKDQDITGIDINVNGNVSYTYGYDTYFMKPVGIAEDGETILVELVKEDEQEAKSK